MLGRMFPRIRRRRRVRNKLPALFGARHLLAVRRFLLLRRKLFPRLAGQIPMCFLALDRLFAVGRLPVLVAPILQGLLGFIARMLVSSALRLVIMGDQLRLARAPLARAPTLVAGHYLPLDLFA